jgi:hypothetical protein
MACNVAAFIACERVDACAIARWVNGETTALCPFCGIDSVLSSEADRIDLDFLKGMHDYWFKAGPRGSGPIAERTWIVK